MNPRLHQLRPPSWKRSRLRLRLHLRCFWVFMCEASRLHSGFKSESNFSTKTEKMIPTDINYKVATIYVTLNQWRSFKSLASFSFTNSGNSREALCQHRVSGWVVPIRSCQMPLSFFFSNGHGQGRESFFV